MNYLNKILKGTVTLNSVLVSSLMLVSTLTSILVLTSTRVRAQQGFGTSTPDKSAVVELSATNKGMLMPRVALLSTKDITTITSAANSLTIFNTATAGISPNNVTPGIYYWDNSAVKWIRQITQGAVFQNIRKTILNAETIASDDYTLIFRSTGAMTLALPDPTTCKGRVLVILNHSDDGSTITFNHTIYVYGDYSGASANPTTLNYSLNNAGQITYGVRMTLQSSGDEWTLIGV